VFQFIETIVLKTTCFAITQTFNAGTYLCSQLFFKSRRDRNKNKHIYLQDVVIHDVRMNDIRSKYIDYIDSDDDSDNEYEECVRNNTPEASVMSRNEVSRHGEVSRNEVSSVNDKRYIEKGLPPIIKDESTSAYTMQSEYKNNTDIEDGLEKQVDIIKEIINDEKYIKEIKLKDQLEKYLNKINIPHETDNEWVNIQVFDEDEFVYIHD
jgi:hypothetical protein